jgi:hypothetical protein
MPDEAALETYARALDRARRDRLAARPADPALDRVFAAAEALVVAALEAADAPRWYRGEQLYDLSPSGSLSITGDAIGSRRVTADGAGGWLETGESVRPPLADVPLKGSRPTEALLVRLEEKFTAARRAQWAFACPATATALKTAKRAFEAALKANGGEWKQYKLHRNGYLPKETVAKPATEAVGA